MATEPEGVQANEVQIHVVVAVTLRDGIAVRAEVADGGGPWDYSDTPQAFTGDDQDEDATEGWRGCYEGEEEAAEQFLAERFASPTGNAN